jgi:hypothetical protein
MGSPTPTKEKVVSNTIPSIFSSPIQCFTILCRKTITYNLSTSLLCEHPVGAFLLDCISEVLSAIPKAILVDPMLKHYKLSSALQYRSKTSPYPFVIAHECHERYLDKDGVQRERTREYYAFDDVEHYLRQKSRYPHSHEVVYPRFGAYKQDITDDTPPKPQQGRLCFDFDIEQRYYTDGNGKMDYVSPSFQDDITDAINETFETYYKVQPEYPNGIDLERLSFVWLESENNKKYSRHLIVKGAYFCNDWVVQSQTFYTLFLLTIYRNRSASYIPIDKLVDTQVARAHATMRMVNNSKRGGNILVAQNKVNIYDTLIQLYRAQDAIIEQNIQESTLRLDLLLDLRAKDTQERKILMDIPQLRKSLEEEERPKGAGLDLTEEAQVLLNDVFETFEVRPGGIEPGRIMLNRINPGECLINPDHEHDHDGAYVTVSEEGIARFYCFRKCMGEDGKRYKLLGSISKKKIGGSPNKVGSPQKKQSTPSPVNRRMKNLVTLLDDREFDKIYKAFRP